MQTKKILLPMTALMSASTIVVAVNAQLLRRAEGSVSRGAEGQPQAASHGVSH